MNEGDVTWRVEVAFDDGSDVRATVRSEQEFWTAEEAQAYIEGELSTLSNPDRVGVWWGGAERGTYGVDDLGDVVWTPDDVDVVAYLGDDGSIRWHNTDPPTARPR